MSERQNPFQKAKVNASEHALTKKVSAALTKLATEIPLWSFKVHGGPYQRAGIPDFVMCIGGLFAVCELKPPDGSWGVQPLQEHEMKKIARAHGRCEVHDTLEGVLGFVGRVWREAEALGIPMTPYVPPERP